MSGIRLGTDWTFTAAGVATQTFGVLAVRGAGKSNLAAVMAEEMHRLRIPFVVVDPVGAWWGLRSSLDGKSPGLDVLIFGGRHGDVPLEKTGGQVLADLVADDRVSCVLDVSEFSEGEKIRFLTDFAERLYRKNSEPLHLFLEEADDYAPQRPMRDQPRLLHAWENIVRRGRARGLGMTMITQRSAALNKNVLTQIETLFVLRTTSPQDRKAIEGWIESHGESKAVIDSLPSLGPGEAWVWSPQWLRTMKRIQVRRRETFDSGATPKEHRGSRPAATLADVDLAKVRESMAATIERAKQEDPRELKKRIAQLERERSSPKTERVEVPVLKPSELISIQKLCAAAEGLQERAEQLHRILEERLHVKTAPIPKEPRAILSRPSRSVDGSSEIGNSGLRRILVALAQHPRGLSHRQIGIFAGISTKGGTFSTYISRARQSGWLNGPSGLVTITPSGLSALGDYDPLPAGRELLDYWLGQFGQSGAARILKVLADAYPSGLSNDEIADRAGISAAGGTFSTYLSRLRGMELVTGRRGELRASDELFE